MTTEIDTERNTLVLIEATHKQDMAAGVFLLTSLSRDELIALSVILANYVVSVAAIAESADFNLAEWIPEQRQRLLDAEAGDGPSPGVA